MIKISVTLALFHGWFFSLSLFCLYICSYCLQNLMILLLKIYNVHAFRGCIEFVQIIIYIVGMSTMDINKEYEDDNKTLDKKQIEAEEKEVMLKAEEENANPAELKTDDGPVKAALSGDLTEQGREVKPKFIPIGAIKMPGFFTKNSDKEKSKVRSYFSSNLYATT